MQNKINLEYERELLNNNINSMLEANNLYDLRGMFDFALDRLETIFTTKYKKLLDNEMRLAIKMTRNHINSVYGINGFTYIDTDSIKVEKGGNNETTNS